MANSEKDFTELLTRFTDDDSCSYDKNQIRLNINDMTLNQIVGEIRQIHNILDLNNVYGIKKFWYQEHIDDIENTVVNKPLMEQWDRCRYIPQSILHNNYCNNVFVAIELLKEMRINVDILPSYMTEEYRKYTLKALHEIKKISDNELDIKVTPFESYHKIIENKRQQIIREEKNIQRLNLLQLEKQLNEERHLCYKKRIIKIGIFLSFLLLCVVLIKYISQ
jgi:hypothetical protein